MIDLKFGFSFSFKRDKSVDALVKHKIQEGERLARELKRLTGKKPDNK